MARPCSSSASVDGNEVLGLFPVDPADNVLHLLVSAVAILTSSPGDRTGQRLGERISPRDLNRSDKR